jgi:hypothetical protein
MGEGITEYRTKEAFSCACCRGHVIALWKGVENTFPWTPICVHMFTYRRGRNILYTPFEDCKRRFVQENNMEAYILT